MQGTSKRKRYLINIGVLVTATVVALLLVEIGFRVYVYRLVSRRAGAPPLPVVVRAASAHRPSAIPELAFEYGANVSFPDDPDFTNSRGLRGPERPFEKPPNTIRIAGLGDSVTAGDLFPADQTFMFALERLLNEAATAPLRFECFNFGVSGYNTEDEAVVLRKKALAYAPDWVILAIVSNDRDRTVYYKVGDEAGTPTLISREYIENVVPFSTGIKPGKKPWWAGSALLRWLHHRSFLKRDHLAGIIRFQTAFSDIASVCRENEIGLLAVIMTEEVELRHEANPRIAWHQLVRETAASENVPVLDMYDAIREELKRRGLESYSRFWTEPRDWHPNAEGHRLIAELVFTKLKSLGILDQEHAPQR